MTKGAPRASEVASEPNICLKVRLKQRMIDRRSSPIVRRKDKVGIPSRRRPITHADSASTPDSGQSSPPNGLPASRSSSGSTPIHEEGGGSPYGPAPGSCSDLNHPFSSLPNISLGRPPHSSQAEGSKLAIVSETEMVSAARAGMPITGHALPSTLPNYPTLTLPGLSALRHQQVIAAMETGGCSAVYHVGGINSGPPINEAQHIRQAVLKRTGSKNHVENVEEETEAAVAEAIASEKTKTEVIDLTDRKLEALEGGVRSPYIYLQERPSLQLCPQRYSFAQAPYCIFYEPLSRALSSPLVTLTSTVSHQEPISISKQGATTGLAYDSAMQSHMCTCGTNDSHPEHGGRIQAIWNRLQETGLAHRCHALPSPGRASLEDIQSCHSEAHTFFFGRFSFRSFFPFLFLSKLEIISFTLSLKLKGTSQISHQNINLRKLGELPIKNFVRLPCAGLGVDSDTTWNEVHTWAAARIAVGCALDLAFKVLNPAVAAGELRNGYAIIRPPGHHAEYQQAMGFCFFNNVAITARQLINKLNLKKVLIVDWVGIFVDWVGIFVDWVDIFVNRVGIFVNRVRIFVDWGDIFVNLDVHHGNGTQATFYDDPRVLYISLHRYDDGSFFPGTGAPFEKLCGSKIYVLFLLFFLQVGEEAGFGYNVNVAWSGGLSPPMGDAEYLAAFRSVVIPIAKDFNPDIVLVSAGFDAATQHPPTLGGYKVSPACFAYMTSALSSVGRGKVVLVLEGGYEVDAICDASDACVRALLGDEGTPVISEHEAARRPCRNAIETLQNVIAYQVIYSSGSDTASQVIYGSSGTAYQSEHWPVLRRTSSLVCLSHLEAKGREDEQETVSAMASLRVDHHQTSHNTSPEPGTAQGNDDEEPMDQETTD
ncbi:Histone deacetylase 4 [Armadillidium nasatum]|uniref:histone deacetylase n=1 Tax=Armadillidium nasatum TaxID=96803 RepID=A0A5N5TK34_9CRUS|nr:Histone deacetylase 4 [Armadillidium nasatum]